MNTEQTLEALKGIIAALEAPTTTDKPSNEALIQAYCAGVRFVIDDMRHERTSVEVSVSAETECGSSDAFSITGDKNLGDAFFEEKGLNGWNDTYDVKAEKYVEGFDDFEILDTLHGIGLCDKPVRPEPPTTDTNNDEA